MKRIVNDLQHYGHEDYETIVGEFVALFGRKYPDVISLYQIGSAGLPSVSDLDLAIVFAEPEPDPATVRRIVSDADAFVRADAARRYIFTHAILKYPRPVFAANPYFVYMPEATLLYGDEVPVTVDPRDRETIDDMMFLMYEANTMRDFERIRRKRTVGLRELLKVLQRAYYHLSRTSYRQNPEVSHDRLRARSAEAKRLRAEAVRQPLDTELERRLMREFDDLYRCVSGAYRSQTALLSEKMTGRRIEREVAVLGSGGLVRQPLFTQYVGALFAREFSAAESCYAQVHAARYPLEITHVAFRPRYVSFVRKLAEVLRPVCRFYERYGSKVSGPLLCYYCRPRLRRSERLRFALQRRIFRIQGLKTT